MTATLDEALAAARRRLGEVGVAPARLDARILACEAFGLSPAQLVAFGDRTADPRRLARFEELVERRAAGTPVGRLLGRREFHGRDFLISPDTLEPRPDTETLVDVVLAAVRSGTVPGSAADGEGLLLADLGTGSGAIAVAILAELPAARAVATDVSEGALSTAAVNARRHGVGERLSLVRGSWFDPLATSFGVVVSNPPYVRTGDIRGLAPEVRLHDPIRALDGGADGLDAYRAIATGVADRLVSGGLLALEIGFDQAADVAAILHRAGLDAVAVHPDLAGLDRVVTARRR